jgi:acyl-CoA thioester hydrolase
MNSTPYTRNVIVQDNWIDYNHHMTVNAYTSLFSDTSYDYTNELGLGSAYREKTGHTMYTLNMKVSFHKEARKGDAICVSFSIADLDTKRIYFLGEMRRVDGTLLADCEILAIHVRQSPIAKAVAFPAEIQNKLMSYKRDLAS